MIVSSLHWRIPYWHEEILTLFLCLSNLAARVDWSLLQDGLSSTCNIKFTLLLQFQANSQNSRQCCFTKIGLWSPKFAPTLAHGWCIVKKLFALRESQLEGRTKEGTLGLLLHHWLSALIKTHSWLRWTKGRSGKAFLEKNSQHSSCQEVMQTFLCWLCTRIRLGQHLC